MVTELIPRYDELAARDVVDQLESGDYDDEQLNQIKDYESENKNRVTVSDKVDELLADNVAEAADVSDEDDLVNVRLGHSGHAAGYVFDSGYEVKTVPKSLRVERRIKDGTLTEVESQDE